MLRLLEPGTEVEQLREELRAVIDPELGLDIVSLGLVYGLELNGRVAAVTITTTTPACPLGEYSRTRSDASCSTAARSTGLRSSSPTGPRGTRR